MNIELQKKLIDKYPKIFPAAPAIYPPEHPIHMYGIECGDGWYELIDCLCRLIQHHIDSNTDREIRQVIAVQIKQKFGGLRFYYEGGNNIIGGMVQTIEYLSYHACEKCGTNQNVTATKGYVQVLCKSCLEAPTNSKLTNKQKRIIDEQVNQ